MPVKTLGLNELAANLKRYGLAGSDALDHGLEAAAKVMAREIAQRAPVGEKIHPQKGNIRSGISWLNKVRYPTDLKNSITVQKLKQTELFNSQPIFRVGPGKKGFHGYFLEYGTKNMPKHPFVRPAFESSEADALSAAALVVAKKLGGGR